MANQDPNYTAKLAAAGNIRRIHPSTNRQLLGTLSTRSGSGVNVLRYINDVETEEKRLDNDLQQAEKDLQIIKDQMITASRVSLADQQRVDAELVGKVVEALREPFVEDAVRAELGRSLVPNEWRSAAQACRELSSTIENETKPELARLDKDLSDVRGCLTKLNTDIQVARSTAKPDLQPELDKAKGEATSWKAAYERLRQEFEGFKAKHQFCSAQRQRLREERDTVRGERDGLADRHSTCSGQLERLNDDLAAVRGEKELLENQHSSCAGQRQSLETELEAVRGEKNELETKHSSYVEQHRGLVAGLETARSENDELTKSMKLAKLTHQSEKDSMARFRSFLLDEISGECGVLSIADGLLDDVFSIYQRLSSTPLVSPFERWQSALTGFVEPSSAQPVLLLRLLLSGGRLGLEDVSAIAQKLCGAGTAHLSILAALIQKRCRSTTAFTVSSALVIVRCLELLLSSGIPSTVAEELWALLEPLIDEARQSSTLLNAFSRFVVGSMNNNHSTLATSLVYVARQRGVLLERGPLKIVPNQPDIICVRGEQAHLVRREKLSLPISGSFVLSIHDYPTTNNTQTVSWVDDNTAVEELRTILGDDFFDVGRPVERPTIVDEH